MPNNELIKSLKTLDISNDTWNQRGVEGRRLLYKKAFSDVYSGRESVPNQTKIDALSIFNQPEIFECHTEGLDQTQPLSRRNNRTIANGCHYLSLLKPVSENNGRLCGSTPTPIEDANDSIKLLYNAINEGDAEKLGTLLRRNSAIINHSFLDWINHTLPNTNPPNSIRIIYESNPLLLAIVGGKTNIIDLLIKSGAKLPPYCDNANISSLRLAVAMDLPLVVSYFLDKDNDELFRVPVDCNFGVASRLRRSAIIELALDNGAYDVFELCLKSASVRGNNSWYSNDLPGPERSPYKVLEHMLENAPSRYDRSIALDAAYLLLCYTNLTKKCYPKLFKFSIWDHPVHEALMKAFKQDITDAFTIIYQQLPKSSIFTLHSAEDFSRLPVDTLFHNILLILGIQSALNFEQKSPVAVETLVPDKRSRKAAYLAYYFIVGKISESQLLAILYLERQAAAGITKEDNSQQSQITNTARIAYYDSVFFKGYNPGGMAYNSRFNAINDYPDNIFLPALPCNDSNITLSPRAKKIKDCLMPLTSGWVSEDEKSTLGSNCVIRATPTAEKETVIAAAHNFSILL